MKSRDNFILFCFKEEILQSMRMSMEIWKNGEEAKLGSEVDGSWAEQKQARLTGGGALLE